MGALIPSYSADNRVIDAALYVTYFKRLVQGSWTGTSLVGGSNSVTYSLMDEYHRVARKSYKYVGMTYQGALDCADAMKLIYTRSVRHQIWNPTGGTLGAWERIAAQSTEMSAEIVPTHVGGDMWEVTINVNEDSIYMSRIDIPQTYASIFSVERTRDYDGETET